MAMYTDLAVGAPYEGDGGAVYIYRGSKLGLIETPSQRITPQLFGQKIQTFGYSIIGGTDIDGNNYPDVVVGSIESSSIVVLRSRPVLNITASLTTSEEYIEIQQLLNPDRIKESIFSLKVCFTYDSQFQKNNENNTRDIPKKLKYRIKSETLAGTSIHRVYFSAFNGSSNVKHSLNLQNHKAPQCENYNVFLNKNNKDFLNPLKFHLYYDLDHGDAQATSKSREKLNDINQHPILDIHCKNISKSVHFRKNCVKSVKCVSNLKVSANIDKPEETSKNEYKILVGEKKDLLLHIKVTNNDEEAHEAMLYVYLPEQIKYKGTDDQGKNYQCEYNNNIVSCLIGNPMPGVNHQLTYALRLDPSDLKPDMQNINITVAVNTTSAELDISDDSFTLFLKVIVQAELKVKGRSSPSDVYFGGEVMGEQAMVSEEDIGNIVVHSYEMKVSWGGLVKSSTLEIEWPYELTNHKHLLYLVDIEYEGDVVCNQESLNKLQYRRNKKDCDRGTAVCVNVKCHIGALTSGESVVVKFISRLWNTTFLQAYTVIMPDQNLGRPKKIELWVIIAAICAGVLLLLIFMLVLWKCGFFNRLRHDEALVHQAKVVNQPLNQQL
ncbi:hypothetical protein HELRODRAFT_175238 [Helobdella robusta]|uniref:Uncharacterized protein n=1 Tax=Helobdella robusta TaxID=6412 RepID=T1F919_HELRO|nr:hypothetical protein HELRODRAFT_175238 [Helobdella robusta]ESO00760.1 hypothetical protein HELRODRAFT_175238 [Helobdella robusta]